MRQWRIWRGTRRIRQLQQSDAVADADDREGTVVAREPGSEKTLGTLLENCEDLLLKVLLYVMDDGLHECRRVCRLWRDACGKLPVELGPLSASRLHRVADLFPEATSVETQSLLDYVDVAGRQAIQHLSRLKNLGSLSLFVESEQPDINSLMASLPSTDGLRSLSVRVNQKDKFNDVIRVLRLLTNLEALTLGVPRFINTDLEPVTQLRGLRYLKTHLPGIFDSRRDLLFPSMTRLTHLELHGFHLRYEPHDPWNTFRLQVCEFR